MRRLAAGGIAVLGLADLVSAVVPPQVRGRLRPLFGYIPLGVSEAAGALVALAGVGLLAVPPWRAQRSSAAGSSSVLLLAGTVALHLIRHGDVVQSIAALGLVAVLWLSRKSFRARFDLPSMRVGLSTLVGRCPRDQLDRGDRSLERGPYPPRGATDFFRRGLVGDHGRLVGIAPSRSTAKVDAFFTRPFWPSGSDLLRLPSFFCSDQSSTGGARAVAP